MSEKTAAVEVDGEHALFCPNPNMPIWSTHPRVFLSLDTQGEAKCPYCGTLYRLKPGASAGGHH